jgi:hypothetical protein
MNPIIQERESHIQSLEWDLRELKHREKIIKNCGFQHRVPHDFFQLSPEEFDREIFSLYDPKGIITMDEHVSYLCKKNDANNPFSRQIYNALFD